MEKVRRKRIWMNWQWEKNRSEENTAPYRGFFYCVLGNEVDTYQLFPDQEQIENQNAMKKNQWNVDKTFTT